MPTMHASESDLLFALLGAALACVFVCVGLVGLGLHRWRLPHTWLFTLTMLCIAWTTAIAPLQTPLGPTHPSFYGLSTLLSGYAGPALLLFSSRALAPRRPLSLGWLALGAPGTAFALLVLADASMLDFVVRFRTPDGPRVHPVLTPLYLAHTMQTLGCVVVSAALVGRGIRRAASGPQRRALYWLLTAHVIGVAAVVVYGLLPGFLHWTWLIQIGPALYAIPGVLLLYRSVASLAEAAAVRPRAEAASRQLVAVAHALRGVSADVARALAAIAEDADVLDAPSLSAHDRRGIAGRIRASAHEAERTVERMMRFAGEAPTGASGPGASDPTTRVAPRLRSLAHTERRAADLDVRVEVDHTAEDAHAAVDPAALDDAIRALIENARAAGSPDRRTRVALRVAVQRPASVEPDALGAELDGSDAVRIDVEDDGTGMAPDVLERALVPFFTTRPGAAGLGLVDVVSAVRGAGGALLLRSAPARGTTVTLWLPLASLSTLPAHDAASPSCALPAIVVVTRDARLGELLTLLLDARGVTTAVLSPEAAAAHLHRAPEVRTALFDAQDADPTIQAIVRSLLTTRTDVGVILLGADPSLARALRLTTAERVRVLRRGASASAVTVALTRASA